MMKAIRQLPVDGDQAGDEDAAQAGAEGCAGVQDGGAAAALRLVHPDGVQLAAGRHDAGFGDADAQAGDEHAEEAAGQPGGGRGGAPADAGGGHDLARTELVDQQADRDLHQGVGPEEGGEQEAHELRGEVEFLLDDGQGHRDGAPVDVVDGDEDQQEQEHLPADVGAPLHAVLAGFVVGERNCGFSVLNRHNFSFTERKIADGGKTWVFAGQEACWWGVLGPDPDGPGSNLRLGIRIAIFWDPILGSQNLE